MSSLKFSGIFSVKSFQKILPQGSSKGLARIANSLCCSGLPIAHEARILNQVRPAIMRRDESLIIALGTDCYARLIAAFHLLTFTRPPINHVSFILSFKRNRYRSLHQHTYCVLQTCYDSSSSRESSPDL